MRYIAVMILGLGTTIGCSKDEPPPPEPPVLGAVEVDCADAEGQDYQVVSKIRATITDEDRDLVIDSLTGSVNGLVISFADGDSIDDEFEWSPPSSWDPPLICRGDLRVIVEAADAKGLTINETRTVAK